MSIACPVYADEATIDYSYQNVPEGYLGMIVDENGNIEELIPMPNARYLPLVGRVFTLEPNKQFISYQYEPTFRFDMGFKFYHNSYEPVTTRDRTLKLEVFNSNSIGGVRNTVKRGYFSTNFEDNLDIISPYIDSEEACVEYLIWSDELSSDKPYYNAVFTNVSDKSMNAFLFVDSH